MAEPNLPTAAVKAFEHLDALWVATTLKAKVTLFAESLAATFPQDNPPGHPVSNWLAVIAALAQTMPATNVEYADLADAADHVYRICLMTQQLEDQGAITNAQSTAVLAAYNAQFT